MSQLSQYIIDKNTKWRNCPSGYFARLPNFILSGRFRCGSLLRHFDPHISGICELCGQELENLPNIILPRCPHLLDRADILLRYAQDTLFQWYFCEWKRRPPKSAIHSGSHCNPNCDHSCPNKQRYTYTVVQRNKLLGIWYSLIFIWCKQTSLNIIIDGFWLNKVLV